MDYTRPDWLGFDASGISGNKTQISTIFQSGFCFQDSRETDGPLKIEPDTITIVLLNKEPDPITIVLLNKEPDQIII